MTNNARIFQEYLRKQDINLEFIDGNEGTVVDIRESLDGGIKARVGVIFHKEDTLVSIIGLDFMGSINQSKRNQLLDLVNELNNSYTYYKFVIANDSIQIQSYIAVDDNYEPSTTMRIIFGMLDIMKNEYSSIMRVMWS